MPDEDTQHFLMLDAAAKRTFEACTELVSGLMKHMKHSKKPKQVKNGFKGLGSGRHGGKKKGGKLLWCPKIHGGRGGVKGAQQRKGRARKSQDKQFCCS